LSAVVSPKYVTIGPTEGGRVGVGVRLGVGVNEGVGVKVTVGVSDGVRVTEGVLVKDGVRVGVGERVSVGVLDGVRVRVAVAVNDGVRVRVGVLVTVGVRVAVAVFVGVPVRVGVRVMVGVALGGGVGVMVGVSDGVNVGPGGVMASSTPLMSATVTLASAFASGSAVGQADAPNRIAMTASMSLASTCWSQLASPRTETACAGPAVRPSTNTATVAQIQTQLCFLDT
jgi:hypothetical protein